MTEPRRRGMRTGFTTGACAAAAAKAATAYLLTGVRPKDVAIRLPSGREAIFALHAAKRAPDGSSALCSVIKDAGDDPDVTHGAEIRARVGRAAAPGIELRGGEGVGTVTRPGLGLEIGGPAINPVPRRMIREAVTETAGEAAGGLVVEISATNGEELAKHTLNGRLGIVGGISILGTTGIVRPYSTAAWRASVGQAIDVAAANGIGRIVLSTGGRSERYAQELLGWPEVAYVEMGEFTGYALRRARTHKMRGVVLAGMIGKLSKVAQGHFMTHVAGNQVDPAYLAGLAAECGASDTDVAAMGAANTARHVQEIALERGVAGFFDRVARAAVERCLDEVHGEMEIGCALFDFDGGLLGKAGTL